MDAGGEYPIFHQQQQPQHLHPNFQQRHNVNLNLLHNHHHHQLVEENVYFTNPNFRIDAPPKTAVLSRLRSRMEKYRSRTQEQSSRYDQLFKKEADEQNKEALTLQRKAMDSKSKKTKTKTNSTTTTDKQPKAIEGNAQMQHSVNVHMPQRNMKRAIEDVENEPTTFEPPTKLPNNAEVKHPEAAAISDAVISGQFTDFSEFLVNETNPHDNTLNDLMNELQDINPEFLESSMIGKVDRDSSILDMLNDKPKDRNLEQFQSDFVKSLEEHDFSKPSSQTQKASFNISSSNVVIEGSARIPTNGNLQTQQHIIQYRDPTQQPNRMLANQVLPANIQMNTSISNQQGNITMQQRTPQTIQSNTNLTMKNQVHLRPQIPQTMLQQRQLLQQQNAISHQNQQPQQSLPINKQQQMSFMNQRNGMHHQQQVQGMQATSSRIQVLPIQSLQKQTQQLQQPTQPLQNIQQQSTSNQMYPSSMPALNIQRMPMQGHTQSQVHMNQIQIQQQMPETRMMSQQISFNQQQSMGNRVLPQQTGQQRTVPMQSNPMQNQMNTIHQNASISQPQMLRQQQINQNPMITQQMMNQQQQAQSYPPNRMTQQVHMQRNPNQMQQPVINNQQSMVVNGAGLQPGMMTQQQHHSQQQMQSNQRLPSMQQHHQYMQQQNTHGQQNMVGNNMGNNQHMGLDFLDNLPIGNGNDMSAHDFLNSLGNDNFIDF